MKPAHWLPQPGMAGGGGASAGGGVGGGGSRASQHPAHSHPRTLKRLSHVQSESPPRSDTHVWPLQVASHENGGEPPMLLPPPPADEVSVAAGVTPAMERLESTSSGGSMLGVVALTRGEAGGRSIHRLRLSRVSSHDLGRSLWLRGRGGG